MKCPTCGSVVTAALGQDDETPLLEHDETRSMTHWSHPPVGGSGIQPALLPGTVIGGRYEIVRLLGQGGMGAVCEARDREVERTVALKVIRGDLAGKPSVLQRFKRELLLAQRVTHPNVVRIFDLGVAGEVRFITMEYIDGEDLASVIKARRKIPPREAVPIMAQVCRGLAAAHAVGIVHRDLKPANIMVDRQGRAAVMDFGIARLMENAHIPEEGDGELPANAAPGITKLGAVVGTPVYMSPEQARRQLVDHRSDLFTTGIILYALLTGKVPGAGTTVGEVMKTRARARIRPLIEVEPEIDPALNAIVMRCLELEPGKRYQSADELARDLETWQVGGEPEKTGFSWPRRSVLAAVASVTIALAAGAAYFSFRPKPAAPKAAVKVIVGDLANTTGNALLDGALEPMIAINLEGASFITVYSQRDARRIATQVAQSTNLDLKTSQLIAQREGIGVVVSGSISRNGDRYRLSVNAIDPITGKALVEQSSEESSAEDLPRAANAAAAAIRKKLGDTTPLSAQAAAAETFTSRSLEASQDYAQAQQLLWRGKMEDALGQYRAAIQKDPDLGRAYAGMAATLANLGRNKDAEEMYRLAMSKLDRMSDREKYRTRGGYYLMRRDYDKAVEQFRSLVKNYPADTAGLGNLALAYFYQRNFPAAIEEGTHAVALYPNNAIQLSNVGWYRMYAGDFDGAAQDFRRVIQMHPTYEKVHVGLGLALLAKGNAGEAFALYDKVAAFSARGASMSVLARADAAIFEGRLQDAASILEAGIKTDVAAKESGRAASKSIALAEARLMAGQKRQALESVSAAVSLNPEDKTLYAAAVVFLNAGQDEKAAALARQISEHLGPEAEVLAKLIAGESRLKNRDSREAVRQFQAAQKLSDTWLGRFGLGRAYLAAGAFTEADTEFEVCLKRRGEATAVFLDDEPTYRYFPQVYYQMGRAQEGLGSPGAVKAYESFLQIKAKSSGELMVEDARRRLKAIAKP